jgi:hypothetical protein
VTETRPKWSSSPRRSAHLSDASTVVSDSFFGCVYQSTRAGVTTATRSSRESVSTTYCSPRWRYTAPSCTVEYARSRSTSPSREPVAPSTTVKASASPDRSEIRAAG